MLDRGLCDVAGVELRRRFLEQQQEVVRATQEQQIQANEWSPDDAIRFQSVLFAVHRALDKVSLHLLIVPIPTDLCLSDTQQVVMHHFFAELQEQKLMLCYTLKLLGNKVIY